MAIQWLKLQQACKKGQVEDSIIEEMQCLTFKNCSCTSLHWEFGKKGAYKKLSIVSKCSRDFEKSTKHTCSMFIRNHYNYFEKRDGWFQSLIFKFPDQ